MFAEMELLGIPHRLVVSEKGLKDDKLEYKGRTDDSSQMIDRDNAVNFIRERMK